MRRGVSGWDVETDRVAAEVREETEVLREETVFLLVVGRLE